MTSSVSNLSMLSLDVNHKTSNDLSDVAASSSVSIRSTDNENNNTIPTADGIENVNTNNNNNNVNTTATTFNKSASSPLQPKRMNDHHHQHHLTNPAEVNKLSVSFAAETTTLSSMLSDEDDEEETNNQSLSPSSRQFNRSLLDANTDDNFGKPYRRSRRQRKSVGYYKWLATNYSENEFVDQNGNPRNNNNDTTISGGGLEDDSMDETKSSIEYEEEESEYVYNDDDEDLSEEEQGTSEEQTATFQPPSASSVSTTMAAAPHTVNSSQDQQVVVAQASEPPASPTTATTTTILSQEVAKNQVVLATPLRRSPRKRRSSIMPEEDGGDTIGVASSSLITVKEQPFKDVVNAETVKEMSSRQDLSQPPPTEPLSPGRILSEPVGNVQRVIITTPLRRSPRKKRCIQGVDDDEDKVTMSTRMPSIAEPAQSPPLVRESSNFIAKAPTSPPTKNAAATASIQDAQLVSKEQGSPTNEILSQPAGNLLQKVASTPILRRSPRKRRSIQGDEVASTMCSIREQAPPFSPPKAASIEAATAAKSDPRGGILSEQVEKNHQVMATPLRRSPRKRQSLQRGDSATSSTLMASIDQAALSPIMKVSSPPPARAAERLEESSKMTMIATEMTTVTNTLSNATIQSPMDEEMRTTTTPVTQSPFSSPPLKHEQESSVTTTTAAATKPQISSITTPVRRRSPRKKESLVEVNHHEPELFVMSPFAAGELSPIQREETSSPAAAALESPKSPFQSPRLENTNSELHNDSLSLEAAATAASTLLLSQFSQQSEAEVVEEEEPVNTDSSGVGVMDIDETIPQSGSETEKAIDEGTAPLGHDVNNELERPCDNKTSNSFVLEYSLEHHEQVATALDEPVTSPLQSKCYKVRIVFDKPPPRPLKSILRTKLRYSKSDGDQVEAETDTTVLLKEHEPTEDESDDTSSHGISLAELKHRMAILFPSDYSQIMQSSCDSARLIACFTLYKDALFVENESMVQPEQQPEEKTAARARTRRRRLSLESKTPGINYLRPIMSFLKELVQLELVQYQSMAMAKQAKGAASNHGSSDAAEEGSHRVHFPAFDGSALQPPSDVIEGSDRVREESIEQLSKVVKASQSLFGALGNLDDQQSESETKKFDSRRGAMRVLQSLVQYLQTDFVTHGHSAPCSMSFPFKYHLRSRVERAAQSYAHDLSHILRTASDGETLECLTYPHSSHDVSIVKRILQSSRCGPWECRLADNAGQQIRYWLRTLLNPIPDRAPPKSASSGAKAKQWRCRICDIVALCVEDAEQSMAVEDGSMSSLVSDALSFLYALFGVSTWQEFVADGDSGGQAEPNGAQTRKRRQVPDTFFVSTISLRHNSIFPHQWDTLEEEMRAATEFLAAMNGVRFLYELFSILVEEPKYHKVWKKTIQDFAGKLALVDEACIQSEDVQLLLLRAPIEEILTVLEKISQQHSSKYIQCQKQLKEFSKRFAFGKKSKRKKKHQPDLGYLETAYEETMEKINFPRAIRL